MKKKTTNAEIDALASLLTQISGSGCEITIPIGFRILQNTEELQKHANLYKQERDRIIRSFAPDGKLGPKDEHYEECRELLMELGALETEVDIQPIRQEELADIKLPMKQLIALRFITEDGKEEQTDG